MNIGNENPNCWPQRCKVCGKRDCFNFHVPDEMWARVVPIQFQNRVVCLGCFDSFASNRGIQYAEALDPEVNFSGDIGSFTLRVEARNQAKIC